LEEAMLKSKLAGPTVSHVSRVHLDIETDAIEAAVGGLNLACVFQFGDILDIVQQWPNITP
jgi:hypothetical protein